MKKRIPRWLPGILLVVLSMVVTVAPAMANNEPHEILTAPFSYRFSGHVTSSTLPGISSGMRFTGALDYRRSPPSTDSLPYVLTVSIDGRTFFSTDGAIQKTLQVDTLDILASRHQISPQLTGYEGNQLGLRFIASGAKWLLIVQGVSRSRGSAREIIISGMIDRFSEIDKVSNELQ